MQALQHLIQIMDDESTMLERRVHKMAQIGLTECDVKNYCYWDPRSYTRNLIHKKEGKYEIILFGWETGQGTPIHDHPYECFMRVIKGNIEEQRFSIGKAGDLIKEEKNILAPGHVGFIDDKRILHTLKNIGGGPAITLHCYSPPIDVCNIFCKDGSIKQCRKMQYYSVCGCLQETSGRERGNWLSS